MGHKVRIGYSFWGFLGPGITDTPDGGRSHRATLVDGLISRGHDLVFLQANRDLQEAGDDLTHRYRWHDGLPDLDLVFLEWRWPIDGRNTTPCGTPGHTCDLHRQDQIVDHYIRAGAPTVIWDKDRQLRGDDPIRRLAHVVVCEAALHPTPGAQALLFPVADDHLDAVDPAQLVAGQRDLPLVYVGNQYHRDRAFDAYFAPAAKKLPHVVAGKWTDTARWPHVDFVGRIAFPDVEALYRRALATVLLLPDWFELSGQMTQRLFEAVLAGCLPLTPVTIRDADQFTPPALHVVGAGDVVETVIHLNAIAGTQAHADLLAACLTMLDLFRLSRQLEVLDRVFDQLTKPRRLGAQTIQPARHRAL